VNCGLCCVVGHARGFDQLCSSDDQNHARQTDLLSHENEDIGKKDGPEDGHEHRACCAWTPTTCDQNRRFAARGGESNKELDPCPAAPGTASLSIVSCGCVFGQDVAGLAVLLPRTEENICDQLQADYFDEN